MREAATGDARGLDALDAERAHVEAALDRVLPRLLERLDDRLAEPVMYALGAGGKRLRPVLCVVAYRIVSGHVPGPYAYDAACAIELVHTYSLIHDDLPCMDDDDMRRGRPSTHRAFGEVRAMVAGAAMIPLACAVLDEGAARLGLSRTERAGVVGELTRAAGAAGMVGGQSLDLAAEGMAVRWEELEAIHRRKTGALFGASLCIGGRLAGADSAKLTALGRCGEALGLAFQVTDDVLDVTSQRAVLGKAAGRDDARGKATAVALLGLDGARALAREAAGRAVQALRQAGLHDDVLETLVEYAVNRDR